MDECEDECMLETCIENKYEIKTAEISAYSECREHDVRFKENNICVLLSRIYINTDTKKYISDMICRTTRNLQKHYLNNIFMML